MKFPKKSLGQNFLIDKNITRKIINLAKIENCNVVEIGPGHGALTDEILKSRPKSLSIIMSPLTTGKLLSSVRSISFIPNP